MVVLKGLNDYMLPCLNKELLGFDCMGCGLQRSLVLILHGKPVDAFFMYPAIYPIIFLFVFLIFDFFKTIKHNEKIKLGLTVLALIFAVTNFILKIFTNQLI